MGLFAQDPRELDRRASEWMHRGMDLVSAGAAEKAVECFNHAIALRRKLPLAKEPRYRYGLAAGWMNRAEALSLPEGKTHRVEALASYEEAVVLLRALPMEADALYPRRLVIALINQALVRRGGGTRVELDAAIAGYREALTLLDQTFARSIADARVLRAAALGNLADALLESGDGGAPEAERVAQQAIELARVNEAEDRKAAEAGAKARHVLCRALAAQSRDGWTLSPEALAAASLAVDEGLALARHREARGDAGFRGLAQELFRFGCRVHQSGAPAFLAKFILESLDPVQVRGAVPMSAENFSAALAALWSAVTQIQRAGFASLTQGQMDGVLEALRGLSVAEDRLKELRRAVPA